MPQDAQQEFQLSDWEGIACRGSSVSEEKKKLLVLSPRLHCSPQSVPHLTCVFAGGVSEIHRLTNLDRSGRKGGAQRRIKSQASGVATQVNSPRLDNGYKAVFSNNAGFTKRLRDVQTQLDDFVVLC